MKKHAGHSLFFKVQAIMYMIGFLAVSADSSDPKACVEEYLKAVKAKDYKAAYVYLSDGERGAASLEQYTSLMEKMYGETKFLSKDIRSMSETLYKFLSERLMMWSLVGQPGLGGKKDIYEISIEFRAVDLFKTLDEISKADKSLSDENLTAEQRDTIMARVIGTLYEDKDPPLSRDTTKYWVQIIGGRCKLTAGVKRIVNEFKAADMRSVADSLKKEGDIKGAVKAWEEIKRLSPGMKDAEDHIKELTAILDQSRKILSVKPAQAAAASITFSNMNADEKGVFLFFDFENTGKKPLSKIYCRTVFLTRTGIALREKKWEIDFEEYQLKPGEKEEKRREFLEPPVGWDPKNGGTYKVEVLKVE